MDGRAWVWTVEVGFRAALHTETHPRDMRWWYGLWNARVSPERPS